MSRWLGQIVFCIGQAIHLVFGVGPTCRYEPTCSTYASDAVAEHGVIKGAYLAAKRIFRCHPWGGSGWDPVPGKDRKGLA